jgi:hypothetical protein
MAQQRLLLFKIILHKRQLKREGTWHICYGVPAFPNLFTVCMRLQASPAALYEGLTNVVTCGSCKSYGRFAKLVPFLATSLQNALPLKGSFSNECWPFSVSMYLSLVLSVSEIDISALSLSPEVSQVSCYNSIRLSRSHVCFLYFPAF